MPRVSAVIPTFGRPALVEKAARSVLAQTMAELELIVVVDGDDPATLACLGAIGDPRLRIIVQETQRGPGEARNAGALAAIGEWVAFLDDDDLWLPAKLERQLALAQEHGQGARPAIVMTLSTVVTPHGSFVRPTAPYDGRHPFDEWLFDRRAWLKGGMSFMQTSSLMMPRALFDDLRFRHSRQHEDWELVIEAVKARGYRLLTVPEALTVHYWDPGRVSLSSERRWAESLAWADRMRPLLTRRAYSGFLLTSIGQASADRGEWSAMLPLLRGAFARGRPTAQQMFRFTATWLLTPDLRRRVRAAWQAQPASAVDRDGAQPTDR